MLNHINLKKLIIWEEKNPLICSEQVSKFASKFPIRRAINGTKSLQLYTKFTWLDMVCMSEMKQLKTNLSYIYTKLDKDLYMNS